MKKLLRMFALTVILSVSFSLVAEAQGKHSAKLKKAQKFLAAGDFTTAFQAYRQLAEEDDIPLAQFTLGLFYDNGWGRAVDRKAACRWYEKAAAGDVPAAAHFAAECLEQGTHRPADLSAAADLYQKAVNLGHTASLCSLGKLYISGAGVPKDPAKGLELCAQAAGQGLTTAQIQMGRFFLEGDPGIRDYTQAISWFQQAAQSTDPQAQYYLGIMARDGLGQTKDRQAALSWLESAAGQGYVPAYLPTGRLYITPPPGAEGLQPPANELAKAYLWLSAAKKSTSPKDRAEAEKALEEVLKIMPETWVPALDLKIEKHLEKFPPIPQ